MRMMDHEAIPVGYTETIDDQGSVAQVHRVEKRLHVIKRHLKAVGCGGFGSEERAQGGE